MIVVLTGGEQSDNIGMSEAAKLGIAALVQRKRGEPEQSLAEVAAIKEVNSIPYHWHTNNTHDYDGDNDDGYRNNSNNKNDDNENNYYYNNIVSGAFSS